MTAVAALTTAAALLAACGGGGGGGSTASPLPSGARAHDATLLSGRKVYMAECVSCHGRRGQGGVGPMFNDGRLLRVFPDRNDQAAFVAAGKGVMPAFQGVLTRRQIEDVVAYERGVLSQPH